MLCSHIIHGISKKYLLNVFELIFVFHVYSIKHFCNLSQGRIGGCQHNHYCSSGPKQTIDYIWRHVYETFRELGVITPPYVLKPHVIMGYLMGGIYASFNIFFPTLFVDIKLL